MSCARKRSSIIHYPLYIIKYQKSKVYKKKKGCHPDNPIFINLKSNTMKNTMQRYGFLGKLQEEDTEKREKAPSS